jgi:hypothetical protein
MKDRIKSMIHMASLGWKRLRKHFEAVMGTNSFETPRGF